MTFHWFCYKCNTTSATSLLFRDALDHPLVYPGLILVNCWFSVSCFVCPFSFWPLYCLSKTCSLWLPVSYFHNLSKSLLFFLLLLLLLRGWIGRFGVVKSYSNLHFFGDACTKSGPLRFFQFSGCWLILSVCRFMSFEFPFGRLLGVR